jgi:hypothetical protein
MMRRRAVGCKCGIIPEYVRRDLGKAHRTSIRITGVPAEIRTKLLSKGNLEL